LQKNGWNVVLHKAMYLPASPGLTVTNRAMDAEERSIAMLHDAPVCCAVRT
jgi:hypothetical protein